jgi:adenine-specific DNA-methyltransferase
MPSLDFKGKQYVYSHHLSVPFRELKTNTEKSLPKDGAPSLDDNLVIHGDNLHALKALLPRYAGKVDCIYIDPPYNTGEEKWCYNDKVNSPLMKVWLEKSANPVDKEDLERHDKWLCMLWPRLQLLKELMSSTGTVFISIDENEYMHLKIMLNEIFGEDKHVSTIVWQKRYSRENREAIGDVHEYIVVYSNNPMHFKKVRNLVEATEEQLQVYKNPNNDPRGDWRPIPMTAQAGHATKEQFYEIKAPAGKIHTPPKGRCWGLAEKTYLDLFSQGRIYFGKDNNSQPNVIRYLDEVDGMVPWTWWPSEEVGHTDEAKKEIYSILGRSLNFDTPKPTRLINRILDIATNKNSLVLDSFAGSATTAHSVIRKNNEDNGNRKFILVECEDYANTLTAERVRKVISGYECQQNFKEEIFQSKITASNLRKVDNILAKADEAIEQSKDKYEIIKQECKKGNFHVFGERKNKQIIKGLGGSFTYCNLGEAFDIEKILTGENLPNYNSLAQYVFYTATGESLNHSVKKKADHFVGETEFFEVYLIYKDDLAYLRSNESALNQEKMDKISKRKSTKQKVVFATAKYMSQSELTDHKITFCQIPYAIHKIAGN